jgi:phenylacetate-coenzyme A ligase PaaK-like adenylate-forming protein
MFIVTRQAEQVVLGFEPVARFQILVNRRAQRDEMTLRLELKDESADRANLAEALNRKFQDICRIKIDSIEFVAKGTIPEEQPKIVDERKWA